MGPKIINSYRFYHENARVFVMDNGTQHFVGGSTILASYFPQEGLMVWYRSYLMKKHKAFKWLKAWADYIEPEDVIWSEINLWGYNEGLDFVKQFVHRNVYNEHVPIEGGENAEESNTEKEVRNSGPRHAIPKL